MRRSALSIDTLQPDGFKILLEILVRHPEFHVSEVFFDFAARNEGQSKADFNEGIRYFRHLTRLRWTVNQHLARFLLVIILGVGLNLLLLGLLVGRFGWPLLSGAALAGAATIVVLLAGEAWVFNDRIPGYTHQRLGITLLLGLLYLLLIYLPMLALLTHWGVHYLLAALLALSIAGFVYYLFSEYWIWGRGLMMRPRSQTYYNIHNLLSVASQVPLAELEHFIVPEEPSQIDLRLRVDRHGTPSHPADAISYDEHLGRFGFSLAVLPGDYTEIVVSPLLESSPSFLYTNVVEPVIHWMLVTRGNAFLPVAAVATPDEQYRARLISGAPDMAYGLLQLATSDNLAFMGDDRIILANDGTVYAYPKPVTINQAMLRDASAATRAVAPLFLQRLVYSRQIRQLGLWLGTRRLPAATLNTYLQRLMPQPKYDVHELAPRVTTAETATADSLIILGPAPTTEPPSQDQTVDELVHKGWAQTGFRPLTQLAAELAMWDDQNWIEQEQAFTRRALKDVNIQVEAIELDNWWERIDNKYSEQPPSVSSVSDTPVKPESLSANTTPHGLS
ncbi:MAG: GtrA family protein [Chloroflexota bacterium]